MSISSVSNRKLHCCLIILILFILIFLSLPLLLIYLANNRYEEWQNQRSQLTNSNSNKNAAAAAAAATTTTGNPGNISTVNGSLTPANTISNVASEAAQNSIGSTNHQATTNCTQYAIQANLSLANENGYCPTGTFPCLSCPDICIEQLHQCDGSADCPDKSDESSCHDSHGAISVMFANIVNIVGKKKQPAGLANATFPRTNLAIPDSCNYEDFVRERCPCVFTDRRVVICEGLGLTDVPNTLLASVYKIRMGNNSIDRIDSVLWPKSLSSLVLVNNRITRIGRSTFETAPNLSKLYLSHNEIAHIDSDAFAGLSSLTSFHIEANRLTTFDAQMLINTPLITKVYLSENLIDLPRETSFSHCRNLKELLLDHNRISIVRSHWFSNMSSLIWLSLTHNQISVIENGSFDWNYELEELNLSFNKIKVINRQMFAHNLNIQRLYLGGNPLEPLPVDAFREIVQLKSLNLTYVDFDYIKNGTFSYLTQLDFIYFAKFRYCHYANHVRVCRPLTDGLSSIEELLAFPILKYAVWIVASVCSLGNVFVFIWRTISPHEDRTLSLFVRNLSIADLMMGIYLGAIGWQDWKFQHNFGRHAIEWMSSWKCTAIGFLAILSSELSVFILTIITIERYRSIMSIRKFEEAAQKRRARIYVALAWLLSFLIAFYPLVEWLLRNSDYYATNGLCLPLHIDQPFTPGWQYSAFIYLGINFSAVMIIIALYIHMYTMIMDGRQASRPVLFKAEKREDAILAIRFFFIVVTDCLCWIPIVVIKVMALANVSISSSIYGWLVVFIIPINSALNPIVYTLAAPTSLRAAVCRLFERICYKVDTILTTGGSNYSSQSSTSGNSEPHIMERRRKNTGSNSTTCDTFETSIGTSIGQPKVSFESDNLTHHFTFPTTTNGAIDSSRPNVVVSVPRSSSSSTPTKTERSRSDRYYNKSEVNDKFYNHYHTSGGREHTKIPYDCLSTYEDTTIKHRIIVNQTADQEHDLSHAGVKSTNCDRRNRQKSLRLIVYDSPERRTRFANDDDDEINSNEETSLPNTSSGGGGIFPRSCCDIDNGQPPNRSSAQTVSADPKISRDCKGIDLIGYTDHSHNHEDLIEDTRLFKEFVKSNSDTRQSSPISTDSNQAQTASSRQYRVSFSSKDSHTCLLSQNGLC